MAKKQTVSKSKFLVIISVFSFAAVIIATFAVQQTQLLSQYAFGGRHDNNNHGKGDMKKTIVITQNDLEMSTNLATAASQDKWFFYNDENDTIDNTLGSFVVGPATPPLGTGSVQINVTGTQRRNLATYQFRGTKLGDITMLKFSTYNPSAGNGGNANRSGYLNFNVDFDGSDSWQHRLVYIPAKNGTVIQNSWQQWDAINGGNALWSFSGSTWPVATAGPDNGATGVSGTTLRTWANILADYPVIRIRATDAWFGIRVGEPYPDGYTENIDDVVFGTSAGTKTFDFEPMTAITTEPSHGEGYGRGNSHGNNPHGENDQEHGNNWNSHY